MKNKLLLFLFSLLACVPNAQSEEATIYLPKEDKSEKLAVSYRKTKYGMGRYLSYRDIPSLIRKYVHGKKALDNGIGTGISTEFLEELGFNVTGVDVSEEMLTQAIKSSPQTPVHLVKNGTLPFESDTYDLVFSSLVLFELGTKEEMVTYLQETERVMKEDGTFIAMTGSQDMYSKDWLIFNVDYKENENLKSGDLAKVYLCDAQIEFSDYYWTEADYQELFEKAGLHLVEIHYPLGKASDPYSWKDEKVVSPFVIFVAKKDKQRNPALR